MRRRERVETVRVADGDLAVHVLADGPPRAPTVIALHSISSNGLAWRPVARAVGSHLRVLAPDMRGRAESAALRSRGLADHATDALAVAAHFGASRPVVAGHSMGAFAAVLAAASHPETFSAVVMVDGGLSFPSSPTAEVDEVLHRLIGPAMDRLTMTFADEDDYLRYWRSHPAIGPLLRSAGHDDLAGYLVHDLAGPPGAMRSSSSLEAVRADWGDMLADPATHAAVHTLQCPAHLLWAQRGPLDEPPGLYSAAALEAAHLPADVVTTPLTGNHYGTLLDPTSVAVVAHALLTLADAPPSPHRGRRVR